MQRWSWLLIVCLLYESVNGIALPTTSLPKCNCIPVKECEPIAYLLLNHKPHEAEMIYRIVQSAGCGYTGLEPLVCCPTTYTNHKVVTRIHTTGNSDDYGGTDPDVWVWGNTQLPTLMETLAAASTVEGRSTKRRSKEFYDETDIFDFKDPKTQRNFPHSFYEESVKLHVGDDDDDSKQDDSKKHRGCGGLGDKHFKHNQHRHRTPFGEHKNYPHNHYHKHDEHNHGNGYEGSGYFDINDEEYPRTIFRPANDGAIIYPDDRRLHRPLQFPLQSITTTSTTTSTTTTTTKKPVNKPLEQSKVNTARCGIPDIDSANSERLYPWISRIAYVNKTNNSISYRCSGSVVSQSHILTAAHCVVNLVSDLQLSHVRIGGVAPNCTANINANCSIASRTYQIAEVRVHPNYDQPKYANDIALVKIVGVASEYTPICLPPNLSVSVRDQLIGSPGIALGWTADLEGSETSSPRVRYLNLPIVNTTECAITYAKFSENFNDPIVITPSQLCAQGGPMNDVCRGDSGGPFMDEGSSGLINSSGRHTLLGIVAFGPTKCGMSNIPGVYTRVSSYLGWIIESISLS